MELRAWGSRKGDASLDQVRTAQTLAGPSSFVNRAVVFSRCARLDRVPDILARSKLQPFIAASYPSVEYRGETRLAMFNGDRIA